MGIAGGFKGAGLFAKLALILFILATICAWIAFTTTGWGENSSGSHIGLWRACSDNDYSPGCTNLDGWANDWWAATQALVTLGFLGINLSLFMVIHYMCIWRCVRNGETAIVTAITAILSGVLYLIGVIVFVIKFKEYYMDPVGYDFSLSYAFFLSCVALVLEIIGGVFMIIDRKKSATSPSG